LKVGYTKVAEACMARTGCKELREAVLLLLSQASSLLTSVLQTNAGMQRVVGVSPWDLAMKSDRIISSFQGLRLSL